MDPERRQAFDDVLRSMRAGRMTRRSFIARMSALGIGAAATVGLLNVVGSRNITYIVWRSEHDGTGTYRRLADAFNASNHDGIHVTYVSGPPNAGELYSDISAMLQPNSGSTDVLSLDVTWVIPFAGNGWLYALEEKWKASERTRYLQTPFQASTYGTHIFAAPYRVDAGMLYYRSDLAPHAPTTWDDLATMSARFEHGSGELAGFVWAGQQSEGLTCLFCEVLASYGGTILRPDNPFSATVGGDAGRQALETMASWIGAASPKAVLSWSDNDALQRWLAGKAVFLRNWASAHPNPQDGATQTVLDASRAVPLLSSGSPSAQGRSCLGGWQLGINAFSHAPDACWQFVQYLLTPAAQKQATLSGGIMPTELSVYHDAQVRAKEPFLATVLPAFEAAVVRPSTTLYSQITQTVQRYVTRALTKESSPADAIARMQVDVQAVCDHSTPFPNSSAAPVLF